MAVRSDSSSAPADGSERDLAGLLIFTRCWRFMRIGCMPPRGLPSPARARPCSYGTQTWTKCHPSCPRLTPRPGRATTAVGVTSSSWRRHGIFVTTTKADEEALERRASPELLLDRDATSFWTPLGWPCTPFERQTLGEVPFMGPRVLQQYLGAVILPHS